MSLVRESEMREMKVCLYRCNVESTPMIFNGTVEHLCPITSRLTNLSQLEILVLRKKNDSDRNACHCAVHESAEEHTCGKVFHLPHRSDREALVKHHSFGLPGCIPCT